MLSNCVGKGEELLDFNEFKRSGRGILYNCVYAPSPLLRLPSMRQAPQALDVAMGRLGIAIQLFTDNPAMRSKRFSESNFKVVGAPDGTRWRDEKWLAKMLAANRDGSSQPPVELTRMPA